MTPIRDEIARYVDAEQRERQLAEAASGAKAKDRHVMLAERYADRAWSLAEQQVDCDPVPSTLWACAT
jgi:hypothetical protein